MDQKQLELLANYKCAYCSGDLCHALDQDGNDAYLCDECEEAWWGFDIEDAQQRLALEKVSNE